MVSLVATNKIRSNFYQRMWRHNPDGTSAVIVSPDAGTTKRYVDMRDNVFFSVAAALSVIGSGSGITKLEIVASSDVAFTAPVVVKDSGTVDADALGDWLILECSAEEVNPLGDNLRYLAGRLTCSNAGDEAIVHYFAIPVHATDGLTPALSIA